MYRFSEINYHPDSNTVDLGAGLIWDDVYAALDPLGAGVVGGRDTGVGIAGYLLGGGKQVSLYVVHHLCIVSMILVLDRLFV